MVEVRNITDFNDYLESLLIQNESDDLEFKSAAGGFPGSFWDTPDFVNEAPYRAFFQTTISPILVICPKKVMAR